MVATARRLCDSVGVYPAGGQIGEVHFAAQQIPRRGHGREAMGQSRRVSHLHIAGTRIQGRALGRKPILRGVLASMEDPEAVAYKHGPGLPPVVHAGKEFPFPKQLPVGCRKKVEGVAGGIVIE